MGCETCTVNGIGKAFKHHSLGISKATFMIMSKSDPGKMAA